MVMIRPFCALRYDLDRAGELSGLIAPPYDVIDAQEQEQLYRASPHNVIRLILGKQDESDTPTDNRYTRARSDFNAWRQQQMLRQDPAPALYLIEHAFTADGRQQSRLGFIALLELAEGIERSVFRHEQTLAAPKEDRAKLMEAVPANLEPIFCIYPDEGGKIQTALTAATRQPPTAEAVLHGESIRLWALTDQSLKHSITQSLASVAVLIADGHHRFEVAYANRKRHDAVMTYFVSMADPGLVVRPIHRVLEPGRGLAVDALRGQCRIETAPDLASLLQWLSQPQEGPGRFGAFDGRALYRLQVAPEALQRWLHAPTVPAPVASLDVSLLHQLLLPQVGINGTGVSYMAEAPKAFEAVAQGQAGTAWFLRGIPLPQIYAIAAQGHTLPPKSTYFYPKVPSGLAIHPFSPINTQ